MGLKQIYSFVFFLGFGIASYAEVIGDHQHIDPFLTIRDFTEVKYAAFSPDNKLALTISANNDIKLWDTTYGYYIHGLFEPFTTGIRHAEFSPDGTKILFYTYWDIKIWDIWRGNWFLHLENRESNVTVSSAHFSTDGNFVVSTASDSTIKIWYAHSGELLRSIYQEGISSAVFADDNLSIVGVLGEHPYAWVNRWDWQGHLLESVFHGEALPVITEPEPYPADGVVWPDVPENTVACPGHPNNPATPVSRPIVPPFVDPADIYGTAGLSYFGQYVGVLPSYHPYSSARYVVWVANRQNPENRVQLTSDAEIRSFSFSKDEEYAVIASADGSATIFRITDGEKLWYLHGHNAQVNSARFSDDGRWIITASDDKTVRFWDVSGLK